MNDDRILSTLGDLQRSSKASLSMVLLGAACLAGALYYSATRLAPLEQRVRALDAALSSKQAQLDQVEARVARTVEAFGQIQAGTQSLLNRQYPDAIRSYQAYVDRFPDNADAQAMLGYAQLKLAKSLRQSGKAPKLSEDRRHELETAESQALALSERHLRESIRLRQGGQPWAAYNLVVMLEHVQRRDEAIQVLTDMLQTEPGMVRWLCEDGQFRPFMRDAEFASRFAAPVDAAAARESLASCWVTQAERRQTGT